MATNKPRMSFEKFQQKYKGVFPKYALCCEAHFLIFMNEGLYIDDGESFTYGNNQ